MMGANGYFDPYDNTLIEWSSYERNSRSRSGSVQSEGPIWRELSSDGKRVQDEQDASAGRSEFDPLDQEALDYLNNPEAWLTKGPRFRILPEEAALEDATAALH